MTPQERLARYREALAQIYGEERANKSELYYARGWYYINLARKAVDGSIGIWGIAAGYRAKQIDEMTATLRRTASLSQSPSDHPAD